MNEVTESAATDKSEKAEKEKPAKLAKLAKFKLTIHSGTDEGDKGDVFLGHNGDTFLIQRDQEAIVDERVINILKDAVIHTTIKDKDGTERAVNIPRYSYNVMPV